MTHANENDASSIDVSRRRFLGRSPAAVAALATAPAWLPKVAFSGNPATRDVLVTVFLRGGIDGLTAVPPYGDADLYNLRPNLAIQAPGAMDGAVDLDGFFGLAPAGAPLLTPYSNGHLLVVQATGSPDPTRSHFEAMDRMETATPNQPGTTTRSGWVARHLQVVAPSGPGDFRGLALEQLMPGTLVDAPATLPIPDPSSYPFPGNPTSESLRRSTIANMYARAPEPLSSAATSTLATIDLLETIDFAGYTPSNGAVYPDVDFAQSLRSAAALIKADVGLEAIHVDLGGWDHHENQGPTDGIFAFLFDQLATGIEAFYRDLQAEVDRYTLVVMSEFGRTAAENGSAGTDHGRGNVMFVMGGGIVGGQVLAQWPGLGAANLDSGDLALTIDYRDILSEIVAQRLGNRDLATVFPGYTPNFQGITS